MQCSLGGIQFWPILVLAGAAVCEQVTDRFRAALALLAAPPDRGAPPLALDLDAVPQSPATHSIWTRWKAGNAALQSLR